MADTTRRIFGDDRARFHSKYEVADSGCWVWTGNVLKCGYGVISISRQAVYAHRYAYELLVGPIPDGLELDHLCHTNASDCAGGFSCRHRRCVNPAHLEPVTHAENVRRSGLHGFGAENAAKTHCPQGHPYEGDNLRIEATTGRRRCKTCQYATIRRYNARKKAS